MDKNKANQLIKNYKNKVKFLQKYEARLMNKAYQKADYHHKDSKGYHDDEPVASKIDPDKYNFYDFVIDSWDYTNWYQLKAQSYKYWCGVDDDMINKYKKLVNNGTKSFRKSNKETSIQIHKLLNQLNESSNIISNQNSEIKRLENKLKHQK